PKGYLLTGHTELYSQYISHFQTLSFPESVVYKKPLWSAKTASTWERQSIQPLTDQRLPRARLGPKHRATTARATTARATTARGSTARGSTARGSTAQHGKRLPSQTARPKSTAPAPNLDPPPGLDQALQSAEGLLQQRAYASAIQQAQDLYTTHPHCDAARKIAAQAYANSGLYDQAKQLCDQVLSRHPLSVDMYYLLAQIAEDQNDLEASKDHLRKIIYLDASYVKAYLDLASIYEREKQPDKTRKMRSYALTLLGKLPPDALLDATSATTIAEWKDYLEKKDLAQNR
ncbi:MAG: tetratricopeptide repeat protein, partial [Nodosilinea sp.]